MKNVKIDDYAILAAQKEGKREVIAVAIPFRRGRMPVSSVRANGFGEVQWVSADGVPEHIGSSEHQVPTDVISRLVTQRPGLMMAEIAEDEIVGEQNLTEVMMQQR